MSTRTITFEDNGQDFSFWVLDSKGVVIDCGPFQGWVWKGTRVHNRKIRPGDQLSITPTFGGKTTLNHRVLSVVGA